MSVCPVEQYARSVVDGSTIAGRLVRRACERHLRDLEQGHERGFHFDHDAANRAFQFFSHLRLPADGEIDGKPFELEPFQKFIVGSLFGWKGDDGYRRFRTAYIEMGKGSGKSPLAGGVGLYGLVADGEAGAEIYSGATTAFQAGILFRDAKRMVEASPALRSRLDVGQHNIAYLKTDSFFRPVSSEHRQLSGPRPHMALIDEIHEHPTAMVVDKLRAGTKSRRQALIFEITNSGSDRNSVCWHHHSYSIQVLEDIVQNDAWFAYVCQLDPCEKCTAEGKDQPTDGCEACDNWQNEEVWEKANPGLDSILPRKYLREQVTEARGMPSKEGIVKRLNFCMWTETVTRAIPMDAWDACKKSVDLALFEKRECFGGIDIGSTSDFTAFALLFPHDDEETIELEEGEGQKRVLLRRSYSMVPFFWLPKVAVKRDEKTEMMIQFWRQQGHVRTTEGDVVDYDVVVDDIEKICAPFSLKEIAIDRGFQGHSTSLNLMKRFGNERVIAFQQGIISMNAPFRELLELIKLRRFHQNGNPIMRWMCANAAAESRGGLIKPSKELSSEKIDGVTAAVMALGRAIVQPPTPPNPYESSGLSWI